MYETINSSNVVMYAIRHYNNPQCEGEKEFEDDLKRFKYIKRLLRKYHDTGILKERLLLNHLIVLHNVFDTTPCVTLLLYKIQEEYWSTLKSFLIFAFVASLVLFVRRYAHDLCEQKQRI